MADNADASTPLVGSSPTSSAQFKWYHYLLIVLLGLVVVAVLLYSFTSVWTFIFIISTILLLAESFVRYIYPLKTDVVSLPFLVSHTSYGFFVSPLIMFVSIIVIYILISIVNTIFVAIIVGIFSLIYPDAAKVFGDDLSAMSASTEAGAGPHFSARMISSEVFPHVSKTFSFIPTVSKVFSHANGGMSPEQAGVMSNKAKQAFTKVWGDMVEAGASPVVMGICIFLIVVVIFLLYVIVAGLLTTSALEHVKWNLFKRHKSIPGMTSVSSDLGVKGVAFVGMTGALAFIYAIVFISAFGIAPTFYSGLIFLTTAVIDAMVIVGAQLLVVTAYAEKEILGKDIELRAAFKKSIIYTFLMSLIRVSAPAATGPEFATPVIIFILFTGLRGFIAVRKTKKIYAHFESVAEEAS